MDEVFASICITIKQANDLILSVRSDVENIIATSKKVSDDVQVITAGVQAGRGTIGKLFKDEKVSDSASRADRDFEKTAVKPARVLQQFTQILSEFQERQIMRKWNRR